VTVVLIVLALILILAVGGAIARKRQLEATEPRFQDHLEQVNHDLAAARASDRGWDPERLEAAARAAFTTAHPGTTVEAVDLIQVEDRPGTDEDKAVYRVRGGGTEATVRLGRTGDDWIPEA
jgi:hypothetical protein